MRPIKSFDLSGLLKIILNKYLLTGAGFLLLMLFFDQNDWFTQRKRQKQLEEVQETIDYLNAESDRMEASLEALNTDPAFLERFAREKYHLKRPTEDVYLITTDTVYPDAGK